MDFFIRNFCSIFVSTKTKFMRKSENILEITPLIDSYLKSIRCYQPLSKEEETSLFELYKNGDDNVKSSVMNRIVNANQRFIFSIAKKYAKKDSTKVLDYVNEGNIGIMNAIKKFDPSRGYKFITFAVWYIRQAMTEYAQNDGLTVRKTNNAKIGNNILKIRNEFFITNKREPTEFEIMERLEVKGIKIKGIRDIEDLRIDSLDSIWNDDIDFSTNPVFIQKSAIPNEFEKISNDEYNIELSSDLLSVLDDRSKDVIRRLFGIGYDYPVDTETIAEELGITVTRVGQIKNAAIKKMRNSFNNSVTLC